MNENNFRILSLGQVSFLKSKRVLKVNQYTGEKKTSAVPLGKVAGSYTSLG